MDLVIFNKTRKILNNPLINSKLVENKHLIFIKYTSDLYYKYSIELLETLCKKSRYENKKLLFHTSLNFLLKILYNCCNIPYLNNFDLLILCAFSLGIKSTENQHKSPSLNKLKRIYPEKYGCYNNEDIKIGEIISIKLLDYNINILTSYECLFYLLNKYNNLYLLDSCVQELDNIIFQGMQKYVFKRPIDIAKESIERAKIKEKQRKSINNYIIPEKKIINTIKGHSSNKNSYKITLKVNKALPNNESISTNASSTANISNNINNLDKNIYNNSLKSKSIIKNNLKDINLSKGRNSKDEEEEKKTKKKFFYNNIDNNNINISPEKRRYNNTISTNNSNNNLECKTSRKKTKIYFGEYNSNKKSEKNLDRLETIVDYENNENNENNNDARRLTNFRKNEKSSPNIFRRPIKVYKKNLKLTFSGSSLNCKDKHIPTSGGGGTGAGEKYKSLKQNIKNTNIILNKMNGCLKIRSNFNYDKINELCHKINFDVFNNKK